MPTVSVLLAAAHSGNYLSEAIRSILAQSFADFELIVVDDGSPDGTAALVESFSDPRLTLLRNSSRMGLASSLNRAIGVSRGHYLARMDADDIALPERLARQVEFLEQHPDVGVCGTWAIDIDANGNRIRERRTPAGERMNRRFWFPSPIIHPTAMIRLSALAELRYDETLQFAQDYDLWLRLRHRARLDNLPIPLLLYRVHPEAATSKHLAEQQMAGYSVYKRHVAPSATFDDYRDRIGSSLLASPFRFAGRSNEIAKCLQIPRSALLPDDLAYARRWLRNRAYRAFDAMRRHLRLK